jgi:hypothetical protein
MLTEDSLTCGGVDVDVESMIINWKDCGRKWSWSNLRYYQGICQEGLGKPTKTSVRVASLWAGPTAR